MKKARVTIIVAYNSKFVIGNNMGKVPWHIPEDFKFFKLHTLGHPCIMGRTTWDSLPQKYKPLPGRLNIVVSRDADNFEFDPIIPTVWQKGSYKDNGAAAVVDSIEFAIDYARMTDREEIFITGGAKIYDYCLEHNLVDRVLASEIHNHLDVDGATFFPDIRAKGWQGKQFREFEDFNVVEFTKP